MLKMVQKVFFGKPNTLTENAILLSTGQKVVLSNRYISILALGIYPQPVFHLTHATVTDILQRF